MQTDFGMIWLRNEYKAWIQETAQKTWNAN